MNKTALEFHLVNITRNRFSSFKTTPQIGHNSRISSLQKKSSVSHILTHQEIFRNHSAFSGYTNVRFKFNQLFTAVIYLYEI